MKLSMVTWRRVLARIGWPGVAGVAFLLAAIGIYTFSVQAQSARLAQLQQENVSLKLRIEQAAKSGIPASGGMEEINRFQDFFAGTPLTERLNRIYAAAAAQKLVLEQGEYHVSRIKSGRLTRYQITLPVKGSYLQIRQFVAQALADVPVAAL